MEGMVGTCALLRSRGKTWPGPFINYVIQTANAEREPARVAQT